MRRLLICFVIALAAAVWPGLLGVAEEAGRGFAAPVTEDTARGSAAPRAEETAQGFASPRAEAAFDAVPLAWGEMADVDLSRGAAFAFTAPSGSVYDVWLFPADEALPVARAELWRDGAMVAEGDGAMPVLSQRLASGAEYVLRLRGEGRARLEIARHALSRCCDMPMLLDAAGDAYSKAFARAGDVHWYAVDADAALPVALVGVPAENSVRLEAMLFDDGGRLVAEAARTTGGAFLMDFDPVAGRRYYIRVASEGGATGLYDLRLRRVSGGALPDRVTLSRQSLVLEGRSGARLGARVSPAGSGGILYWESSDIAVAQVDASGRVTGRDEGEAVITAYAAGGMSDRCHVRVRRVPVQGVSLVTRRLAISVGDDAAIECEVLPANASDPRLLYAAEPAGIVEVDRRGVVRGLGEGTATVTVTARDGGLRDALVVTVGPAPKRWRALLVGEQNYASTVAAVRTGSINSVTGLRSMLEGLSFDGACFQVTTLLDASRDQALAAVSRIFADAREGDVSLFYITCHGFYAGGMTCFQMYDGSVLTASELARALRGAKGELLVVIDCCGSGGVIGRASGTGDILKGIDAVFGGGVGPAVLGTSRFRVLASAAMEQDSYRLAFEDGEGEPGMATVFARALCEAGGWSVDRGARTAMRADADTDGAVTLSELYAYCARRVMWYLKLTGDVTGEPGRYAQTVQVWPEGDGSVVFER